MNHINCEVISIRNPFSQRLYLIKKLLVTYPKYFSFVSIYTELRHKRNCRRFHWMIIRNLSCRKLWAVFKINFFIQSIKLRAWAIILFSYPVVISCFFASVAKKTRFFLAVEAERLVTVKEFINFIYSFRSYYCFDKKCIIV